MTTAAPEVALLGASLATWSYVLAVGGSAGQWSSIAQPVGGGPEPAPVVKPKPAPPPQVAPAADRPLSSDEMRLIARVGELG